MFAVWKLCVFKIKRNKEYNILIAIIIFLSSLLLSTALVIINSTSGSYIDIHAKLNGSHEILKLTNEIYEPNKINTWWQSQSGVITSGVLQYYSLTGVTHKENNINIFLDMTDASGYFANVDRLQFVSGSEQKRPTDGTIWIPTSLAYKNDISLGDKLTFLVDNEPFTLKVGGIVIDLPYCAPFTSTARIWMSEKDYTQYRKTIPENYAISLRYEDYKESRIYWHDFENYLAAPYLESVTNFETLSSFYMVINRIIGFVMIFLAFLMILIAIGSIGFTISDDILSNYKTVGIIKSLGMTSANSVSVYLLQYTVLSLFSVAFGIIGSYFLSGIIINNSMSYLKMENEMISFHFGYIAVSIFMLLIFLIFACVFLFARKIRTITPVRAIRCDKSEVYSYKKVSYRTKFIQKTLGFTKLPVTLTIGFRGIVSKIRASIFIIIVVAMMASVLSFCFTFINSINNIEQTIAMWGYDSSDITINVDNLSRISFVEILNKLNVDNRIKNYNLYSDINAVIPSVMDIKTGEVLVESMSVWLSVVDGSYDDIGFNNLDGRNPINDKEISIGINLAQNYDIDIGDTITTYIQGKQYSFTVTGIYQAITNMAYSGRICIYSIKNIIPNYDIQDVIFVNVKERAFAEQIVTELNNQYGSNIYVSTQKELVDDVFSTIVLVLMVPMLILSLSFIGVTLIIIYCNIYSNTKRELKNYGIYKSLGMRSSTLRFSISSSILALELIGAVLGSIVGIIFLPKLLNIVLANYGILKVPLVVDFFGIACVVIAGVILSNFGSWFASKVLKKTSPRILTTD